MTCVELFLLLPIIFTPLMLTQNIYLLIVLAAYIIPLDKHPAISVCEVLQKNHWKGSDENC